MQHVTATVGSVLVLLLALKSHNSPEWRTKFVAFLCTIKQGMNGFTEIPGSFYVSISGVLWRFLGVYVALMIMAAIAFQLLGFTPNSGVNVGILICAVLWPCMVFGTKNKRYFTAPEKTKVVWGMIAINLMLQLLVGGGALAAEGKLTAGTLGVAMLIVGVLHSLAIAYFVGAGGKLHDKQLQKQAAAGD